jgi:hypothetical protein
MKIPIEILRVIFSFFEEWRILNTYMKPRYRRIISLKKISSIKRFFLVNQYSSIIFNINEKKKFIFAIGRSYKGIICNKVICWMEFL